MAARILVINDDRARRVLQEALQDPAIIIDSWPGPGAACRPDLHLYDLLIVDIAFTRCDEFRSIRDALPQVPLILLTSSGDLETAVEAVKWRAWDHLCRPFSTDTIKTLVKNVLYVPNDLQQKKRQEHGGNQSPLFVGSSCAMTAFYKQVARVADAAVSVLIEGESGTGKELAARALHLLSTRRKNLFMAVHCGAIPDTLLESELFGYERGAFTGADRSHSGLIESAGDGTLFLDELSEMTTPLQGKLLRFMQNGEVRRLGGNRVRHVKVRVVASTNRDIDHAVQTDRFRADLLYRFVVRLKMPPLRDHKEDIPQLVDHFLQKTAASDVCVSQEVMDMLFAYNWPGNVRELENVLNQVRLFFPYPVIHPEHLPERFRRFSTHKLPHFTPLENAERSEILQTMLSQGWNQSKAARILGIDRKTLRAKIHRYWLEKEG